MGVSFRADTLEAARSVSAGCLTTTTSVVSCTLVNICNITSTPVTFVRPSDVPGRQWRQWGTASGDTLQGVTLEGKNCG